MHLPHAQDGVGVDAKDRAQPLVVARVVLTEREVACREDVRRHARELARNEHTPGRAVLPVESVVNHGVHGKGA